MQDTPEFTFSLNIPVFRPSPEEMEGMSNPAHIEPYLTKLLKSGYISQEELAAYIKFVLNLSSFTPFLLDEFVNVYRKNTAREDSELITPKGSKIIVP